MVLLLDVGGHEVGAQVRRDAIKPAHVHNFRLVGRRLGLVLLDGARHPGHLSCSAAWSRQHSYRNDGPVCELLGVVDPGMRYALNPSLFSQTSADHSK